MRRLLLIFLLCAATASAEDWRLSETSWGFVADSVRLNVYTGVDLTSTALAGAVSEWDTTLSATDGELTTAVHLIYYWGQATPLAWPHTRNLKRNATGGFSWRLCDAIFPAPTDSAYLYQYQDTTLVYADSNTSAPTDYDVILTAYAASYNQANILIWYTGETTARLWNWTWDLTDTTSTSISLPGVPNLCRVYGTVMNRDGSRIYGATVLAVGRTGDNATGSSNGNNIVMSSRPVGATTDPSGYFEMYLVGTHEYADTTRGFYDITCEYDGQQIFKIPSVWVPSSGSWNIADTLNLRRR